LFLVSLRGGETTRRLVFSALAILVLTQFILSILLSPPTSAQGWKVRVKPKGTLNVVDLLFPSVSIRGNCSEQLVGLDKNYNLIPRLAEDWRWIDDRTIELKLRRGVFFHNGEEFNAETVRVNWENYRKMKVPVSARYLLLPDKTNLEITDDYRVKFIFPGPDGLAIHKFLLFAQIVPAFFKKHQFAEYNWGYFTEPGPWGTGPFRLIEESVPFFGRPSDRIVLEAYENYWDPQYPKVQRVIFDNTLLGNREEAMRLCRETEGAVNIVSHIRPLDTLKVAESPFAKVVKSKDVSIFWGYFNQRKRDNKWRDVRLRKAVNYAINRKELWKYAAKGNAYNLEGFPIPAGEFGFNPDLNEYGYDTNKARSLLTEAGYPNGFQMEIITIEATKLEAQIISKMLERVGSKWNSIYSRFQNLLWKRISPHWRGFLKNKSGI
jgi:peptide/nickel transport system substrate-binding protein